MSNVNVRRLVENIRSGTNIYTPLVELVVNAIQAIDQKGGENGLIQIEILRSGQADIIDRLEDIDGFVVKDNGVGFTKTNRDSFDTLYTEQKIADGGKGFGRFTCLKYFNHVKVASTFTVGDEFHDRSFRMGLGKDIIVDEKTSTSEKRETGTAFEISGIKSVKFPDKRLDTVCRVIVERLLPYFVDKDRACPRIVIREANEPSGGVSLNDYLGKENSQIVEMPVEQSTFTLTANEEAKDFDVRVFKFYTPRSAKSKVSLVAHRREVTDNPLQAYIPEFAEEFYEGGPEQDLSKGRNFVVKSYVFGDYLNDNVSLERGEFRFQNDNDLLTGISQSEIEQKAAEIAQSTVGSEITERKMRKQARI
ncbi:MAG: ATPase, partial [Rhodobacterales bacterium 17-64-5]